MPEQTPEERADQNAREQEVRYGQEARRILESDILQGCLTALKLRYRTAWENSPLGDTETREAAYRMLRSCNEFEQLLTSLIESGDLAAEQLALVIAQQEAEREQDEELP